MNVKNILRITDPDGHLVCMLDEDEKIITIKRKDYLTSIQFDADGNLVAKFEKLVVAS